MEQAIEELAAAKAAVDAVRQLRASWISRPSCSAGALVKKVAAEFRITVEGKSYDVKCEEI